MRITKHITFYFREDRFEYINRIICETNAYEYPADIFIHTNERTVSGTYKHEESEEPEPYKVEVYKNINYISLD